MNAAVTLKGAISMLNSKLFKNTRTYYKQMYTQMDNYIIGEDVFLARVMPALNKLAAQLINDGITMTDIKDVEGPFGSDLRDMMAAHLGDYNNYSDAAKYFRILKMDGVNCFKEVLL